MTDRKSKIFKSAFVKVWDSGCSVCTVYNVRDAVFAGREKEKEKEKRKRNEGIRNEGNELGVVDAKRLFTLEALSSRQLSDSPRIWCHLPWDADRSDRPDSTCRLSSNPGQGSVYETKHAPLHRNPALKTS